MKLFDTVALEEVELTEADSRPVIDTDDSLDTIFDDYMEMEDMSEGADTYYSIQNALGDIPSTQAQEIADIAIESIRTRLSIPATSVSLESDDEDKDEKNEDGFFTRVWKAIKNFFAKIWGWIKGLFSKKKDDIKKVKDVVESDIEKLEEHLKKIIKYNESVEKSIKEMLETNSSKSSSHIHKFKFMNKAVSIKDLVDFNHNLKRNIDFMQAVGKSFVDRSNFILHNLNEFTKDSNLTNEVQLNRLTHIHTSIFTPSSENSFDSAVLGIQSDESFRKEINKKMEDHHLSDTVRILHPMSNGNNIVFVKKQSEVDENRYSYYINEIKINTDEFKISYDESLKHESSLLDILNGQKQLASTLHTFELYAVGLETQIKSVNDNIAKTLVAYDKKITETEFATNYKPLQQTLLNNIKYLKDFSLHNQNGFIRFIGSTLESARDLVNVFKDISAMHTEAVKKHKDQL
jgi:hypothetical protein